MKKLFLIILALLWVTQLSAAEAVTSESLVSILQGAGYEAFVDEEGDASFYDQYEMLYWATPDYPEENSIYIQSGWSATENVTSDEAYKIANEGNRQVFTIRCFYEPLTRTFYTDYTLRYPETELDEEVFLRTVESFLSEADTYTDYLIGEGAL